MDFNDFMRRATADWDNARGSLGQAVESGGQRIAAVAVDIEQSRAGRFVERAAVGTYNFLIGDDIRTLRDPNAGVLDKTMAGISIASNFVGPEGKVFGHSLTLLTKVAEHALEHGGVELAEKELERLVGKEGMQALDKALTDSGKFVQRHAPDIEKFITKAAELTGAAKAVETAPEQVKKTVDDIEAVFRSGASTWERVQAAGEVSKDLYALYGDYRSIHKGVKGLSTAPPPSPGANLTKTMKAHPEDGERGTIGNNHPIVETERATFDARGGKTMREQSVRDLGDLAAKEQRPVIVIGHDLDHATQRRLADVGVLVAKDASAAKTLEQILRLPGAEQAKALAQQLQNSDVYVAYEQRKHVNTVKDAVDNAQTRAEDEVTTVRQSADNAVQRINDARIGVGSRHHEAAPYDGKTHTGTITFAEPGRIEQYIGQNKYMTYTEAQLGGQAPHAGDQMQILASGQVTIQQPTALEHAR